MTFHYAPHTYTQHTLALIHALPAYNKNDHFTIRPFIIVVSSRCRCRCRWYVLRIVLSNPFHFHSVPIHSIPYTIVYRWFADPYNVCIYSTLNSKRAMIFIYLSLQRNKKNVQKLKEKRFSNKLVSGGHLYGLMHTAYIYYSQHMDIQHDGCRESISLCAYSSNCIFLQLQWNSIEIGMRWHFNRQAAWLLPGIGPIFIV